MVKNTYQMSQKEKEEVNKLLKEWFPIAKAKDPKKQAKSDKIRKRIWEIKRGNIRPF